ncbi:hypothetical protein M3904_003173 [Vibrio parahaemolyticus]|nr:hypothetical protein [Vibrio parahaemolyticus]
MSILDPDKHHSFTATSRGLMIIFVIGLIKVVVGVEFIDPQITIPWLPKISFEHLERLSYLYIALIFYALLRYHLHNRSAFKTAAILSLTEGLKSGRIGKWFVERYILGKGESFIVSNYLTQTQSSERELTPPHSVAISSFQEEHPTETFVLIARDGVRIDSAVSKVHISVGLEQKALTDDKLANKWGPLWNCSRDMDDGDNSYYRSDRITSRSLWWLLAFITTYYEMKYTFKDFRGLDTYLPWFLNLALFTYMFCTYIILG